MARSRSMHRNIFPYLLFIVPIMVHIVVTIIQDCVFGVPHAVTEYLQHIQIIITSTQKLDDVIPDHIRLCVKI